MSSDDEDPVGSEEEGECLEREEEEDGIEEEKCPECGSYSDWGDFCRHCGHCIVCCSGVNEMSDDTHHIVLQQLLSEDEGADGHLDAAHISADDDDDDWSREASVPSVKVGGEEDRAREASSQTAQGGVDVIFEKVERLDYGAVLSLRDKIVKLHISRSKGRFGAAWKVRLRELQTNVVFCVGYSYSQAAQDPDAQERGPRSHSRVQIYCSCLPKMLKTASFTLTDESLDTFQIDYGKLKFEKTAIMDRLLRFWPARRTKRITIESKNVIYVAVFRRKDERSKVIIHVGGTSKTVRVRFKGHQYGARPIFFDQITNGASGISKLMGDRDRSFSGGEIRPYPAVVLLWDVWRGSDVVHSIFKEPFKGFCLLEAKWRSFLKAELRKSEALRKVCEVRDGR